MEEQQEKQKENVNTFSEYVKYIEKNVSGNKYNSELKKVKDYYEMSGSKSKKNN